MSQKYHSLSKIKTLYFKLEGDRRHVLYNILNSLIQKKLRESFREVELVAEQNRVNAFILGLEKIRRIYRRKMKQNYKSILDFANSVNYNPWVDVAISKLTVEAPLIYQTTFWKMKRLVEDDMKELIQGRETKAKLSKLCIMLDNKFNMQKAKAFYKVHAIPRFMMNNSMIGNTSFGSGMDA